jgi:hypothetical protein
MRWDALFADLEAQADALEQAERAAEVETRTRGELAALTVTDRLRGSVDAPVRLRLDGGVLIAGRLARVGPDWLLVDEGAGREVLIVTRRVLAVRGLGRLTAVPDALGTGGAAGGAGVVAARLGLRHALRGIARDRSVVRLLLAVHDAVDGAVDGTIDRVGADFVELAAHPAGEARRHRDVREVELVPMSALVGVRRAV